MDLLGALSQTAGRKAAMTSVPPAEDQTDESFTSIFDQEGMQTKVEEHLVEAAILFAPLVESVAEQAVGKQDSDWVEGTVLENNLLGDDMPAKVELFPEFNAPQHYTAPVLKDQKDSVASQTSASQSSETAKPQVGVALADFNIMPQGADGNKSVPYPLQKAVFEVNPKLASGGLYSLPEIPKEATGFAISKDTMVAKLSRAHAIESEIAGPAKVKQPNSNLPGLAPDPPLPSSALSGGKHFNSEQLPAFSGADPSSSYVKIPTDPIIAVSPNVTTLLSIDDPAETTKPTLQNPMASSLHETPARVSESITALRFGATQPLQASPVATQIAIQISGTRAKEIELRLEPEELGKVRITIQPRDMGLIVILNAERPETLDLLRKNADELLLELNEMEVGDASLQFTGDGADESLNDEPTESEEKAGEVEGKKLSLMPQTVVEEDRLDIRL